MFLFIPGFIISLWTFPGVLLHEMSHKFFCDYYNIAVFRVNYFALSSNAGHVIHEKTNNAYEQAMISIAPIGINSLVCIIMLTPYFIAWALETNFCYDINIVHLFLLWVGISCGLTAIPSKIDLKNIKYRDSMWISIMICISEFCNALAFAGNLLWMAFLLGIGYLFFKLIISFLL